MIQLMDRPAWLFDREALFADLARFAARPRPGLAIVRGRRRHGKSAVLRALAEAGGLFYHQVVQGVPGEQRRDLARAFARHHGGLEPRFDSWTDAVEALLHGPHRGAVVIDELPYLTQSAPELESVLQRALDAAPTGANPLIVCGSAVSVMTGLLVGSAPLRGRAQLEIDVVPFDYRTAACFCNLSPDTALGVHAAIGGVPGYATDLIDAQFPGDPGDLDRWMVEVVASPRRPLVHEARSMLDLEVGIRDPTTYVSVLGAIASGATRTSEVASRLGRSADAVSHALATLVGLGLIARRTDALGSARPTYAVVDPLLRLYVAALRPHWQWVERGDAARLAEHVLEPWHAQILGPHLEHLLREWARDYADASSLGGSPVSVGWGTVDDPERRIRHEVDLVVHGQGKRVLALGEAKWRTITSADLDRLVHIRGLLPRAAKARLVLCSATGFEPGLARVGVELVDVDRLYLGS